MNLELRCIATLTLSFALGSCSILHQRDFETTRAIASTSAELSDFVAAAQNFIKTDESSEFSWFANSNLKSFIRSGGNIRDAVSGHEWQEAERRMVSQSMNVERIDLPLSGPYGIPISFKFYIFKDGIFSQAYFGNTWSVQYQKVTQTQPWLAWDRNQLKIIAHRGGAQQALAQRLCTDRSIGKIQLYRGLTRPYEVKLLQSLGLLRKENVSAEDRISAKTLWLEGIGSLLGTRANFSFEPFQISKAISASQLMANQSIGAKEAAMQAAIALFELQTKRIGAPREWTNSISMSTSRKIAEQFGTRIDTTIANNDGSRDANRGAARTIVTLEFTNEECASFANEGDIYLGIEDEPEAALISQRAHLLFYLRGTIEPN